MESPASAGACAGLTEPVRALSDDDCVRTAAGFSGGLATCCTPTPAPTPATNRAAPAAALPQPLASWSENIGRCAANEALRPPAGGGDASAPRRKRSKIGNGSKPATRVAIRSRTGGRANSPRSSPAASASRRQVWQCERWRARRRVSRVPSRLSAAVMMIVWMRRQRAPETMSSNSSVSRRRARNSVDSTAGRLIPIRRPISCVGEALELAQDEDLVVGLGEPAERAAEAVEVLLGRDRGVGRQARADQARVVGRARGPRRRRRRPPRRAWSGGTRRCSCSWRSGTATA